MGATRPTPVSERGKKEISEERGRGAYAGAKVATVSSCLLVRAERGAVWTAAEFGPRSLLLRACRFPDLRVGVHGWVAARRGRECEGKGC